MVRRKKEKRVEEEKQLISTYDLDQLYNVRALYIQEYKMYRLQIQVDNTVYFSMSETAKALKISETTLRRRLNSDKFPEYQILDYVTHGYQKVVVNNKKYPTVYSLIEKGLVATRQQAIYRLKSTLLKWRDWLYDRSEDKKKRCMKVERLSRKGVGHKRVRNSRNPVRVKI